MTISSITAGLFSTPSCEMSFPKQDRSDKGSGLAVPQACLAEPAPCCHEPAPSEVDHPASVSTNYTMFLPDGTPLVAIAKAKPEELAAYQHNQSDLEFLRAELRAAGKADGIGVRWEGPDLDAARMAARFNLGAKS